MITLPDSDRDGILGDLMPDLTPLLDVMFMLIVFLILTANAVPFAIDIDLPEDQDGVSRELDEQKVITLTLLPESDGWKVNDTPYQTEETMQSALIEAYSENKQQRVVIAGEKAVSMQKLIRAITFLKKQEIQAADIIVEQN